MCSSGGGWAAMRPIRKKRGFDHVDADVSPLSRATSSDVDVGKALSSAISLGSPCNVVKYPWESSPALRFVFFNDLTPWLFPPKIPRHLPPVSLTCPEPVFESLDIKRSKVRQQCHAELHGDSCERASAALKWVELLMLNPLECNCLPLQANMAQGFSCKRFTTRSGQKLPAQLS